MTVFLVLGLGLAGFAVWKFLSSDWTSTWRTRRSGPSSNWQNEGYMASQDGKSWSQIDGTITDSAPPSRETPAPPLGS